MNPLTNTILNLHLKDGLWKIPAETIAKEHGKIYSVSHVGEIILKLPNVIQELRKSEDYEEICHLVSLDFFSGDQIFRVPLDKWEESVVNQWYAYQQARQCLPIRGQRKNHGVRFVPAGKHDYLYWVWDCYTNASARGKVYIMTKVETLAIRQGILPAPATFNLMASRAMAISDAINGTEGLPRPVANLKDGIDKLIENAWRESFLGGDENTRKKSDGDKKKKKKHDPNYDPGFKKGYGYK